MSEVHGKNGDVSFAGLTAGVSNYDFDNLIDIHEVTDFAAGGQKKFITGNKDWKAEVTANYDPANTAEPGDEDTLVLTATAGSTYTGNAILHNVKLGVDAQGGQEIATYSFQGNGALQIS